MLHLTYSKEVSLAQTFLKQDSIVKIKSILQSTILEDIFILPTFKQTRH